MERTLQSLDHVISYYCVAQEVSDAITAGPGDGLNNFLQVLIFSHYNDHLVFLIPDIYK